MTFLEFIEQNRNVSADTLRLKFHGKGYPWLESAITQIECLNKAGKKFTIDGESVLPQKLVSSLSLEQATAAQIAAFHSSLINPNDKVLDMTMGLGMDSRAFALNGASKVIACETNTILSKASEHNYRDIPNLYILNIDSVEYLKSCKDNFFDIIFADPARRDAKGERVYNLHDCVPDLINLLPLIKQKTPRFLAKLSPMLDVSQTLSDLPGTHILYVVDDGNECKELLADIRRETPEIPLIIVRSGQHIFGFTRNDELNSELKYAIPKIGDVLYEPSPAMMKAAPFKLMSNLTLGALAQHTHLYVAAYETAIPGKYIRITDICSLSSSGAKEISKKYPRLNLATRNFPSSVKDLAKKLKIKDGGDLRAIAVTLANSERCLIIGQPVTCAGDYA